MLQHAVAEEKQKNERCMRRAGGASVWASIHRTVLFATIVGPVLSDMTRRLQSVAEQQPYLAFCILYFG